jgi:hypothetical protein
MKRKNGIQGAYNQKSELSIAEEARQFGKEWVRSMVQTLNYDPKDKERWQQFAKRKSA